MNKRFVVFAFLLLGCFAVALAAGKHKYTLVIDAGHGGKDAGACAFGAKEKTINLNVALAFGRYVEQNCPDVKVIYTRKTDIFVPLHQRAAIANRNKADVFISIHTNALKGRHPISGMETYTMGIRRSDEKLSAAMRENEVISYESDYKQRYAGYDPRSPESMMIFQIMNEQNMAKSVELASLIQKYTCKTARRPNKGVKQDAFLVLRETSMPACLIELGYITTRSDKNYLVNKRNVDLMGRGIYQAFVAFKNQQQARVAKSVRVANTRSEPVAERRSEPVAEPKSEPVAEPKSEPVAKVKPEPVAEPKSEPVAEPKSEPVAESEPELVAEEVVDSVSETEESPLALSAEAPAEESEEEEATATVQSNPIFKVQLLVSKTPFRKGDRRLKGITDVDYYQENGWYKYTVGSSENYSQIYRLRKSVLKKFPQAFIIAFRDGQKMDAAKAYQEYKQKRK